MNSHTLLAMPSRIRLLIVFFIVCASVQLAFRKPGYVLAGKLEAPSGTVIRILYQMDGRNVMDSAEVLDQKVLIKGILPESVVCTLSNSVNRQIRIFIAENRDMQFEGSLEKFFNLKFSGTPEQEMFEEFKKVSFGYANAYREQIREKKGESGNKQGSEYMYYRSKVDSVTRFFVKSNSSSTAASLAMIETYLVNNEREKAASCYKLLSDQGKNTVYARRVDLFAKSAQAIQKGRPAPDFSAKDLNGKMINLADIRGSYIFVDFWASWCPPCRAEHPLLKRLHKKYLDENIQFVSVSMDASVSAWKAAVQLDGLEWMQLNDPTSLNGLIADRYGVKALPFNCIIDPQGNILELKLRGNSLEMFLEKLFENKIPVRDRQ